MPTCGALPVNDPAIDVGVDGVEGREGDDAQGPPSPPVPLPGMANQGGNASVI